MTTDIRPIRLGYTSYETYISEETLKQIEAFIKGKTYCDTCKCKFTEERVEVAKNECLPCFLRRHSNLEYTDTIWHDKDGIPQYLFVDSRGHITVTSPDSPTVQENIWATLKYWGFTLPESVKVNGLDVELILWRWHSLYSHPGTWAVIATHQPNYGGKLLTFLLTKDGNALFLDRRSKRVRDLLAQAKEEIKAGKSARDVEEYGSRYDPSDYMVYRRLADMVTEEHDAQERKAAS